MGGLFASLGIAGNSLDVLQQAIGVIQNNVTNATTPGYVTQTQQLASRAFDPSQESLRRSRSHGRAECPRHLCRTIGLDAPASSQVWPPAIG